jgi:hypothetical protein
VLIRHDHEMPIVVRIQVEDDEAPLASDNTAFSVVFFFDPVAENTSAFVASRA